MNAEPCCDLEVLMWSAQFIDYIIIRIYTIYIYIYILCCYWPCIDMLVHMHISQRLFVEVLGLGFPSYHAEVCVRCRHQEFHEKVMWTTSNWRAVWRYSSQCHLESELIDIWVLGVYTPKSSHFVSRVFPYKPSILGYHYFWKHPYIRCFFPKNWGLWDCEDGCPCIQDPGRPDDTQ